METTLYRPVKQFLESLGYVVKGEIGSCDIVALKGDEPIHVLITELKLSFNLELVLQGVDRMAVGDEVWLAGRLSARGKGRESDPRFKNLCRRLGLGLLGITSAGGVEILLSPVSPIPRKDPKRRSRLVDEHRRRRGDPAEGGTTRVPIMTAYRQQALACAAAMQMAPCRLRDLTPVAPKAPAIVRHNVYGWFVKAERGVYGLTAIGRSALLRWPPAAGVGQS